MNKWVFASIGMLAFAATGHAGVCRVTPSATAGADGASWATAKSLQSALKNSACNEIWAAEGVYTPGTAKTDTFELLTAIALYGGFAGNESLRAERNPEIHKTILSGDIDHNDINTDGNQIAETTADIQGGNSYHVVTMLSGYNGLITGTTVLDGFIITAGFADYGAGVRVQGGGLFCSGHGPGMNCSPRLANLVFSGNQAFMDGGALYNDGAEGGTSSPTLDHVTFTGNSCYNKGGAMFNNGENGNASPTLSNVRFIDNFAIASMSGFGGAIYNAGSGGVSSPTFSHALFSGNIAKVNGGAMFNDGRNDGQSSPILHNVTFSGNSAEYGGALNNLGSENGNSSPTLINVTFHDNHAITAGGTMNNYGQGGTAAATMVNVIVWGDTSDDRAPGIYNSGEPTISHSIIEGGVAGIDDHKGGVTTDAGGNLSLDPGLGALANHGGYTETHAIGGNSPAVDAGDDGQCPADDQRGVARPQMLHCDIGAYELTDLIFANGLE